MHKQSSRQDERPSTEDDRTRYLTTELLAAKKRESQLRQDMQRLEGSLSWRITRPLREINAFLQRQGVPLAALRFAYGQFRTSLRMFGLFKTLLKIITFAKTGKLRSLVAQRRSRLLLNMNGDNSSFNSFYPKITSRTATTFMPPRISIVGEMSIPQCKKYRVTQKAELFAKVGLDVRVLNWTDLESVRNTIQTHSAIIFYRVPAVPEIIALIQEAKRLGVHTFWEVDDLIFDPEGYLSNKNLESLTKEVRDGVLDGMRLYREALLLCDEGIGSTSTLAQVMSQTTGRNAYVIENALDRETLATAELIRQGAKRSAVTKDNDIIIVYGSGTKTHDIDFLSASEAIWNVLAKRQNVRLRIIGELNIEDRFNDFSNRIERLPFSNFESYLRCISEADISIAPLENTIFNDAKSNIKFLEASILELPSVCSPANSFKTIISNGENGFLASTTEEWEQRLLTLIDNQSLRINMAKRAHSSVTAAYHPDNVAQRQLAPIIDKVNARRRDVKRILFVNVFFSPQSFGGATIVAEELAKRLGLNDKVELFIFTSWQNNNAPDYGIVRYDAKGATVFAVKTPMTRTSHLDVEDDQMAEVFEEVLQSVQPDVVDFHSIQTLGVSLTSACNKHNIPYVITLHDAWWLCERQFMVTGENKFCFQTRIDPMVCATCVSNSNFNRYRTNLLRSALSSANGLIAPSSYFKTLHMANGIPEKHIFVNKNGVQRPSANYKRNPTDRIRFGYVGGATAIKGYDVVKKAFSQFPPSNIELIMVDNTLNQGFSSVDANGMSNNNPVKIVPAYTQTTIDDFFSQIDVLLFPTQWKESFGLTVREALLRDVWVIASDAGGVVEDIVDGENGNIIPISNDASYLHAAMKKVVANRQTLRDYSNPYKARITGFDDQAKELYRFLIQTSRATDNADCPQ